jgi:hypothetical protein
MMDATEKKDSEVQFHISGQKEGEGRDLNIFLLQKISTIRISKEIFLAIWLDTP